MKITQTNTFAALLVTLLTAQNSTASQISTPLAATPLKPKLPQSQSKIIPGTTHHAASTQAPGVSQMVPAIAKNCRVVRDARNNTIIYLKRTSITLLHKVATIPPMSKQVSSGIGGYYQHDQSGYGGDFVEGNALFEVNVQNVDGDGFIVSESDSTVCHVFIANVSRTGLIIKGSRNTLHDVVLINCKIPLRIDGSNNTVICTVLNMPDTDVDAALAQPTDQNATGEVDASTTRVDGQILRR